MLNILIEAIYRVKKILSTKEDTHDTVTSEHIARIDVEINKSGYKLDAWDNVLLGAEKTIRMEGTIAVKRIFVNLRHVILKIK